MARPIKTRDAPAPGNYSQGTVTDLGDYFVVHTSGQCGVDSKTGNFVSERTGAQTTWALNNIESIIKGAKGDRFSIAHITVYLDDISPDNKAEFEKSYGDFFQGQFPARELVEVSDLPLQNEDTRVMISAVAYVKKRIKK